MSANHAAVLLAKRAWSMPSLRFLSGFILILGVLEFVYALAAGPVSSFRDWNVGIVTASANRMGLQASALGSIVSFGTGKFAYDLGEGCTGLSVMLALVAAVVAFPAPARARLWGVVAGVLFLFLFNTTRLVTMGWAGLFSEPLFHALHMIGWQLMTIGAAAVFFVAWVHFTRKELDSKTLRSLGIEMGIAFAILVAVFVPLWYVGAWQYGMAYWGKATAALIHMFQLLMGFESVGPNFALKSDQVRFGVMPYLTWAGFCALFLATPRFSWRRRLAGACLFFTPILLIVPAFAWAIRLHTEPWSPEARSVFDGMQLFGLPLLTWFTWYGWAWIMPGKYACPRCGAKHNDILSHIETKHPDRARKLTHRLQEKHPELRAERGDDVE